MSEYTKRTRWTEDEDTIISQGVKLRKMDKIIRADLEQHGFFRTEKQIASYRRKRGMIHLRNNSAAIASYIAAKQEKTTQTREEKCRAADERFTAAMLAAGFKLRAGRPPTTSTVRVSHIIGFVPRSSPLAD